MNDEFFLSFALIALGSSAIIFILALIFLIFRGSFKFGSARCWIAVLVASSIFLIVFGIWYREATAWKLISKVESPSGLYVAGFQRELRYFFADGWLASGRLVITDENGDSVVSKSISDYDFGAIRPIALEWKGNEVVVAKINRTGEPFDLIECTIDP